MTKFIVTVFLCCSSFFMLAQQKINQKDANGNRQGLWKKYYKNSDQLRYQGTFKNGKEIGTFTFYTKTSKDQPTIIKTYNALGVASVRFFSEQGMLISKGKMKGKSRIGLWTYYHKDAKTPMLQENYKNGVLQGVAKVFYKTGKISETFTYKDGQFNGVSKKYAENGTLLHHIFYKSGMFDGLFTYYNAKGQVTIKGKYRANTRIGVWQYYKNGVLNHEKDYTHTDNPKYKK